MNNEPLETMITFLPYYILRMENSVTYKVISPFE